MPNILTNRLVALIGTYNNTNEVNAIFESSYECLKQRQFSCALDFTSELVYFAKDQIPGRLLNYCVAKRDMNTFTKSLTYINHLYPQDSAERSTILSDALHEAALIGSIDMIKILLLHRADINAVHPRVKPFKPIRKLATMNAVEAALFARDEKTARFLLVNGAEITQVFSPNGTSNNCAISCINFAAFASEAMVKSINSSIYIQLALKLHPSKELEDPAQRKFANNFSVSYSYDFKFLHDWLRCRVETRLMTGFDNNEEYEFLVSALREYLWLVPNHHPLKNVPLSYISDITYYSRLLEGLRAQVQFTQPQALFIRHEQFVPVNESQVDTTDTYAPPKKDTSPQIIDGHIYHAPAKSEESEPVPRVYEATPYRPTFFNPAPVFAPLISQRYYPVGISLYPESSPVTMIAQTQSQPNSIIVPILPPEPRGCGCTLL